MPCDYSKYPANWHTEIRPAVLARAKHRCEQCRVLDRAIGCRLEDGSFSYQAGNLYWDEMHYRRSNEETRDALAMVQESWKENGREGPKPILIVLTIAHLDRTGAPGENDGPLDCSLDRLRALCQRCHFRLDHKRHRAKAAAARALRKSLPLFPETV